MQSVRTAIAAVSVLAMASGTAANAASAARPICPAGYSLIAAICLSDATGDIVLPIQKKAIASLHAKERQR